MELKQKLAKFRIEAGLSQSDVAEKLGITRQAYNHYETGRRTPDLETATKLAKIYNVSIDFLVSGETEAPARGILDKALQRLLVGATDEDKQMLISILERLQDKK